MTTPKKWLCLPTTPPDPSPEPSFLRWQAGASRAPSEGLIITAESALWIGKREDLTEAIAIVTRPAAPRLHDVLRVAEEEAQRCGDGETAQVLRALRGGP